VLQSQIEIDHISETGGTFKGLDDIKDYAAYLYLIDFSSIRALCIPCHDVVTLAQANGITLEQAKIEKQANEIMRQGKAKLLAFLTDNGYNTASLTNDTKRKAALVDHFSKEIA
jgi:hypothetical protein